jgi:lysophospholipase L1-like esterase
MRNNSFPHRLAYFCLLLGAGCFLLFGEALAQTKIMPLGNSITAGFGSTHGGGYRLRLYELLIADQNIGAFDFVGQFSSGFGLEDKNHEGHPGFQVNDLRVETYLRDNPADIILLEIGTNDIAGGHSAEQTATDIANLVDRIHAEAPDAIILLGAIIPQLDLSHDIEVDKVNLLLPQVVNSRLAADYRIFLVDHNGRFKERGNDWPTVYMADDLHPSDRGYEEMAAEWYATIQRVVRPTMKRFSDGFDREDIGEDWTAHSAFGIQNDQLVNTADGSKNDKWDQFFAICNVVLDPNIVEMKYGYLSDNEGRAFTGLALKLTDNNLTASGYLLHHNYDKLRLWAVSNGVPTQIIAQADGFPETASGDVFRVEMKTDESGHHFKILRNGVVLATLDDPQKRFNGPYCGVMINGNTNNGIDEFFCEDDRDLSAPARVSDLTVTATTYSTVTLEWTAPGDDASNGTATSYDIRYSVNKILNDNDFAEARPIPEKIDPSEGGTSENLAIGGLESGKTYHFALKAVDDQGNLSPLSNDASGSTASLTLFKDNFNRPDGNLGADWAGDLTNLQIRSGTVQNIAAGDIWSPAVFKNGKNAVEVTIKYGSKATAYGINFSGVFVLVDGPSATPNGYMIQHYSDNTPTDFSDDETRLWLVQSGRVARVIASGRSQSNKTPGPGAKLTVRIIKENGQRYFYVYVDDVFDRVLSDPDQRYNGLYAGFVMESKLGEQNAIDEITFGSAPTGPKSMTKILATDNQIAPILQPLPLPLRVAVADSFDNPLSGAAVKFSVVSGTAKITPPPSIDGNIRIDAEDGEIAGPLEIRSDSEASSGKYLVYPNSQTADATVTFTFQITKPGTYYLWTRNIWTGAQGASWDVRSDSNPFFIYDVFYGGKSSLWAWDRVRERGIGGTAEQPLYDPKTFDFNLGQHKLVFRVRFKELRLDKILLTTDPAYVPFGKEEKGFLTDANGEAAAVVTLGSAAGPVTIQAALTSLPPVTFTAIATGGQATKISLNAGSGQSGSAGQTLQPFKVLVQDANNNAVAGQQIIWVVTNGNGTLSQYKSITGLDGIASTVLKLGNSSPTNTVEARTTLSGSPIIFNATTISGVATTAAIVSSPASGAVHTALAAPLVAKVMTGNGLPAPNFPVDFRVTAGGGSLSPKFSVSNGDFETAALNTTSPLNWTLENAPSPAEVLLSTSAPHGGTKSLQINSTRDGVGVSQAVSYPAIGSYTLSFYVKVLSGAAQVVWRMNDVAGNQIEKVIDITSLATGGNWILYNIAADNGAATPRNLIFKTFSSGNFFIDDVKVSRNTDANGQIAINFTLGDTAMAQKVQAEAKVGNTNLTGSPLTFSVQANPAAAKNQKIDSGNNQSGSAGQLLAAPFVVKVVDQYGNGIPNRNVTFTVKKGGGKINNNLTSATQQTNASGLAQVTYKLGPVAGDTNKVDATSSGLNTVRFVSFAAIPNKVTKVNPPTVGSANKKLNQPLSVKVTDASNKAIAGYPVTFLMKQGGGKLNKDSTRISIATDANGAANVFLTLGPTPGAINRVEAYVLFNGQKLPNPVLSFSVKAATLKELALTGGNNQAGPACEPLAQPFKVKVVDSLGVGIAGQTVTFLVKTGGGKLNTNLDSVKVTTDTAGVAQSKLTLGPKPGTNQVTVTSAAKLAGSPMTFTATGRVGAAAVLKKISGDSLFALINTALSKPQVVLITDKCGNVIAGAEVKFKIKAGGGKVNGSDSVAVTTGADGKAQAAWKLGSSSGVFNNKLEARAFNGAAELTNSPIIFYASATPNAARSLKAASATSFSGHAGSTLTTPLMAKVSDGANGSGNGVPNHEVKFIVTKGGGVFGNGNAEIIVKTDQSGVAKVFWTLGGALGNNGQEVRAFSTNAGANLEGVPVIFTATATTGAPSAEGSEIKATGPIPADGATKSQVTVYVRDKFGNPLSGKAVTLIVSPPGSYFIDQPTNLTNAQGLAAGSFASLNSGGKIITAKVLDSGTELNKGATVEVTPLAASQMSLVRGNNQTCNIQSAVGKPLEVKVADRNGNGVPNYEVKFAVQSGSGSIYEPPPIRTDANGIAAATFVGGASIGQSQIWAESKGLNNSPVIFLATVVNNIARNLVEVSGNAQKGQVGQILPAPLVVRVTDKDGNPVSGKAVRFDVTFGGGTIDERSTLTINSNEFGEARVTWRLGPSAGPHTVRVSSTNLTGSPVDFRAEAAAGRPENLVIYSGQDAAGDVGSASSPMCVRVTDGSGNGVDGVEVLFELVRGTGSLSPNGPLPVLQVITHGGGFACASVTFGSDAGYRRVIASASGLSGSPRTFYPYGRALAAQTMKMVARTNNQNGTKGKTLNFPLQVFVQDRLGNPVPNFAVTYLITNGGGSFNGVNPYSAKTDSMGIAEAPWMLGRFATDNEANAVGSGNVQPQTIVFKAKGFDNNFPVFEDVPDRKVTKGDKIEFSVLASDPDSDPLTYGAKNLPAGATFDSLSSRVFKWSTVASLPGQYAISFLVRDNKGGSDEELVIIDVKNRNSRPIIESRFPVGRGISTEQDTVLDFNATLLMRVTARDPDGDPLNYRWYLNGKYAGAATNTYLFNSPEHFNTVTALVFDQEDTISTTWSIQVPVKLSSFSATLQSAATGSDKVVKLEWKTASEINNAGFNILRSRSGAGRFEKINRQLIPARRDGQYVFVDDGVEAGGRYYYKLEDIDLDGNVTLHGPVSIEVAAPQEYVLQQNYPNPFNPTTQIRYDLPKAGHVTLLIFNSLGQEVRRLVDREQPAGYHFATWNGRDQQGKPVPTGVYHYRLQVGDFVSTKKMMMAK